MPIIEKALVSIPKDISYSLIVLLCFTFSDILSSCVAFFVQSKNANARGDYKTAKNSGHIALRLCIAAIMFEFIIILVISLPFTLSRPFRIRNRY